MAFKTADRSDLDSVSILDSIPSDDKCRFIVKIISRLDLSPLHDRYSSQGGDAYDPAILLAIWFYAYSLGITSSREVERLCHVHICFMYVSANLRPDHTTLCRFRRENADLMKFFFVQILELLAESGITDFGEINIDGTKMKASANKKKSKTADKLSRQLERVREQIASYMQDCESCDSQEDEADLEAIEKKLAQLKRQEQIILERQSQLEARKEELKPEHRDNHKINLTDPDARLMPKADGPSYNAQAAVDSQSRVIVANDVTTEPNDQNQFSVMHQQVEENLGPDPDRKHNGDSGYHTLEELDNIEEKHIDAVIADPTPENRSNRSIPTEPQVILDEKRKVKRSDFTYHPDEDSYECPQGKKLEAAGKFNNKKSQGTIYQSPGCEGCPLLDACLPKNNTSGVKRIYRDHREELAEEMHQKLQTPEAKERLKTRSTTSEPVFGNIKENIGIRGFRLRGLKLVKGEFNLICIAHNLNILFNLCGGRLDKLVGDAIYTLLLPVSGAKYARFYADLRVSKIKMLLIAVFAFKAIYARLRGC